MIIKPGQIFNLMDTNGRRNDVINALQGYLSILDTILNERHMQWGNFPLSLAQYEFYKQAIELSPDVFCKHDPYDNLLIYLKKNNPELLQNIEESNLSWIQKHGNEYQKLRVKFDKGIEDRARHYTTNLVKLGFTDLERIISPVGNILLGRMPLFKDKLEKILPLNETNIVYLRQLLKLRIFSSNGDYYSPFNMALMALMIKPRISLNEFCELIQGVNPCNPISDIEKYIKEYKEGNLFKNFKVSIPEDFLINTKLDSQIFRGNFTNQKSSSTIDTYYKYYCSLFDFQKNPSQDNLNKLLTVYEQNKSVLDKAFGFGSSIFAIKKGDRPSIEQFLQDYSDYFEENINIKIYDCFSRSKYLDSLREYSDTTIRIFKATGLISFDNGYVELAYRELCHRIFDYSIIKEHTFGHIDYENYRGYEDNLNSYFLQVHSVTQIMDYSEKEINKILNNIQTDFNCLDIKDIPLVIAQKRKDDFSCYIENNYPIDKVKELLVLFSDRKNDPKIKKLFREETSVPTIYEYVIGLAWYYFSNKSIDLLNSYNLTLSADFEPITHAGGGVGDIVIYDDEKVIMLEVTLMNTNNQKRGEWEPVLRHSVNLKVEEEEKKTNREVTTFFIADSFDTNTINIWKAVSSVPLESSIVKNKFTNNVIIMPINNKELIRLIDKKDEYENIIKTVRELFIDESQFDMQWRNRFISSIVN